MTIDHVTVRRDVLQPNAAGGMRVPGAGEAMITVEDASFGQPMLPEDTLLDFTRRLRGAEARVLHAALEVAKCQRFIDLRASGPEIRALFDASHDMLVHRREAEAKLATIIQETI